MRAPAASAIPPVRRPAIWPVDLATHIYLAAISILIACFAIRSAWPFLLIATGSSVVLLGIQRWSRFRSDRAGAAARFLYFAAIVPAFYLQLKALIPAIHPRPLDDVLRRFDQQIFGTDPTVALQAAVHPVATEILQLAYMSYYLLPLILPILLLRQGRVRETERYALALLSAYYVTYLGYIAVPANGPSATIPHDVELRGLFLGGPLYRWILAVDAHRFDCFPSGHTAVAIIVAVCAWRFRMGGLAIFLTVDAFLILVATVYMRYHYVIDLPPGMVVAAGCYALSEWVYVQSPRGARSPPSAPS